MSDRMTSIGLPGKFGCGLAEYGRQTVPQMINAFREHARAEKAKAEMILAAADTDFRIETYLGVYVQRHVEVLQPGNSQPNTEAK